MRALLRHLPLEWRIPAVRGVAALVTFLVWLLLAALLIDSLESALMAILWLFFGSPSLSSNHAFRDGLVVVSSIVLVFPLAWSRPWTRLARVMGQPLAPRHAEAPLLTDGHVYLRQRNLLCRALAWSAALALGAWVLTLQSPLWAESRLLNTPLEGGSMVLGLVIAVLVMTFVGGGAQGLSRRWAHGRLTGDVQGWVASDGLTLGANLLVVSALALAFAAWQPFVTPREPVLAESLLVLPSALAWWLCYVMLLHALAPPAAVLEPLWLAVLPPAAEDAIARTDLRTLLALVHHLAGEWRIGPVFVLLPSSGSVGGEHLLAAEDAGQRDLLFPRLPVQWRDWQRLQPPAARWSSLPLRELHLPDGAMLAAARELVPTDARLVVIAAPGAAADLPGWRAMLRDRTGALYCTGTPSPDVKAARVERSELRAGRLRAAARQLLEPLRPRAEAPQAQADADAAAKPGRLALDLPGILHPGRFALLAVLTGAFVLIVYAAMAFEVHRASDEAFTAIRDVATLRSPPAAPPQPAAAPAATR